MRTVQVVLHHLAHAAADGLLEVLVVVKPHLLLLQAALQACAVAVALAMVVRDPLLDYAEPIQRFDITR